MPVITFGNFGDGLEPCNIGGKSGNCDPPRRNTLQQGIKAVLHRKFGAGDPFLEDIGGIANHGENTDFGDFLHLGKIAGRPHHRIGVQFPVTAVQYPAIRRGDHQRLHFRYAVGEINEIDVKLPQGHGPAGRDDIHLDIFLKPFFRQLEGKNFRRERACINRATELRPEPRHRAHMILMRMGDDDTEKILPPIRNPARIRHDHIDARRPVIGKGNAAVNHQPFTVTAIKVEIHADFPTATKRKKIKALLQNTVRIRHAAVCLFFQKISTSPASVRSGSTWSITSVPLSKRAASPPVAMTFNSSPYSARIRPISPSIIAIYPQ